MSTEAGFSRSRPVAGVALVGDPLACVLEVVKLPSPSAHRPGRRTDARATAWLIVDRIDGWRNQMFLPDVTHLCSDRGREVGQTMTRPIPARCAC